MVVVCVLYAAEGMGCFQSTPEGPTPAQIAAAAEAKRQAELKAAEDKRIETERREREEKEIAARVAAALEQKRIEAEQLGMCLFV